MPDVPARSKPKRFAIRPADLVLESLKAWAARDVEGTVARFAPEFRHTLNVDDGPLPLAGTGEGVEVVKQRLAAFLDMFDFLAYVVDRVTEDGETVRTSIVYWYRHKKTGLELNGRYRHVWRVVDGRILSCDEYHDAAALKAYMDLVTQGGG